MTTPHRRFGVASLIAFTALAVPALPSIVEAQATAAGRATAFTRPQGWLGVHYSAEAKIDATGDGLMISYNSHPVIEAIEPGSPAERSGLQVGDTLLAFNGHDFVRQGVPLTTLLRPGQRLSIRLRRGGVRTVAVTVGERPPGAFGYRMSVAPGARVMMNPSVAPLIAFSPSGSMSIAGAEMVPVNPQLGDVLGVRKGVLLVNVPAVTPAARSGLRAGDVVVRAGGAEILDPAALHMAMIHAGPAKALQLEVVRKGKAQRMTLRW